MPEGPEVKKMSEYLNNYFNNNKILNINILKGRYTKKIPKNLNAFKEKIPLSVDKVKTKGKFIYFLLEKDISIWNTLGMSGYWSTKKVKHSNIEFITDKGSIYFVDQRNFGTIQFCFSVSCLEKKLDSLGPDMLSSNMNFEVFRERILLKRNLKKPIAKVLLDQKIVSGIGNYLRSEILWLSKISPFRLVSNLNDNELNILYTNSLQLIWIYYNIRKALKLKKITEKEIQNINPNRGFLVYMQEIDRNKRKIIREKIGDRSIHWVPSYQT